MDAREILVNTININGNDMKLYACASADSVSKQLIRKFTDANVTRSTELLRLFLPGRAYPIDKCHLGERVWGRDYKYLTNQCLSLCLYGYSYDC